MADPIVELVKLLNDAEEASKERALLVRLGEVLFWVCYALAALLAVFGVWIFFQPSHSIKMLALFFVIAFGFCLLGSVFKYALAVLPPFRT
jgi:hypothetical protein